MVIRILTGKDVAGTVRYNEQKVKKGQAERIHTANYPDAGMATKHSRFRLQLLEQYARLNPGVSKPSVHIAVAFHPSELLTSDQLRTIGNEVMTEAGFGKQPYLIYEHNDTPHPHIHIVSVAVDGRGNRISDKFVKTRLQQIRRRLEVRYDLVRAETQQKLKEPGRVGEEQSAAVKDRQTISNLLMRTLETYTFGSVESLKQYLKGEGLHMNLQAGRSQLGITYQQTEGQEANNRPLKASSIPLRPTRARLEEWLAGQADRHHKRCKALIALIEKRLALYRSLSEADFKQSLRQVGIEVIETEGTYLYIQRREGVVAQEAELGKSSYRQLLAERFTDKTERWPTVSGVTRSLAARKPDENEAVPVGEQTHPHRHSPDGPRAGLSTADQVDNDQGNGVKPQAGRNAQRPEPADRTSEQAGKAEQAEGPIKKKQKKIRRKKTRRL